MSSRNRARREANREARQSAERARNKSLHRRFVIIVLALLSAPLCVFAATKALHSEKNRVVVDPAAASEGSSTTTPQTSVVTVKKPKTPGSSVTGTSVLTYRTVPATQRSRNNNPPAYVPPATSPQTVVRYLPAPTTAAPPPPPQKPCVAFNDTIQGGGTVPVPVGPAPTSLVVRDLVHGSGAAVTAHTTLTVDYVAVACSTGKIVDASYQHGGPSTLKLDNVIVGWQLGMPGARVGGTRLLGVPATLAYGSAGRPPIIGKNEALWFKVTVRATNVTIGVPSPPTNVVATPQPGAAKLTWTAPNDNGAPITQYVISTYVDGNLQAQQTAYTTASSMTISSLTAGTQYTFKVAARNSYGIGPQSAASNVMTPT